MAQQHEAAASGGTNKVRGQALQAAVEAGVVPARGAAGLAFSRALAADPALRDKYSGLRTRQAAADFRVAWAKEEVAKRTTAGRTHVQAQRTALWKKGRHLPPSKILEEQGRDAAGLEAARAIIRYCVARGDPWAKLNKITGRTE